MKNLLIALLLIATTVLGTLVATSGQELGARSASGGSIQVINSHNATSTYLTEKSLNPYLTATSSFLLAPGFLAYEGVFDHVGTATMQAFVDGVTHLTVALDMVGSTTASIINLEMQVTGDGRMWYDYVFRNPVQSDNVSPRDGFNAATSTLITVIPGGYGTSTFAVPINLEDVAARAIRLKIGAGGATSTVRAQLLLE